MEYLVVIFFVLFGAFANRLMSVSTRRVYYNFILIFVILLLGLRYEVGGDTVGYMSAYSRVPSITDLWETDFSQNRFEPGYLFVCALCRLFTSEFWLAQIVMAAITNCCIFIFIYRYCRNPFVGVFFYIIIYCLYFTTEIIRESAAVGIFLINYKNLEHNNFKKYYLMSLLSISFHYSAIIIWLFPFIKFLRFNYLYIALICGFLAIMPLVENLNQMLAITSISNRVNAYVIGADELNLNWRIMELIKSGFPAVAILLLLKIYKFDSKFKPYALLQILFCVGAFAIPLIFSRFANYTGLFVVALIANSLSYRRFSILLRSLLFCSILLIQGYVFSRMSYRWLPYVSVLEPKNVLREDPNR